MHLFKRKIRTTPKGSADFAQSNKFELLQRHAHGGRLSTSIQRYQVNTGGYAVEVHDVVVLASRQCAQVVVDDLLTNQVVHHDRSFTSFGRAELQIGLLSKWVREYTCYIAQRLLRYSYVYA